MSLPYCKLRSSTDSLPNPSREYVRMFVKDENGSQTVFAVHKRIARQCKLLDAVLDELELMEADPQSDAFEGSACIPDVDIEACQSAFDYLELTTTRVPSIISRPLRAPLQELVQPWEYDFLQERCLEKGNVAHHQKLLCVMQVSDFLMIDSLRDLCCAFLASIALHCRTEVELLTLLGLPRPASSDELELIYSQFPFLK